MLRSRRPSASASAYARRTCSSPGTPGLPGYIRGQTGVVDIIQPAHVLPDTNAHFLGEKPQQVYRSGSTHANGGAPTPNASPSP
ncbi:SH3-like domain-containing protein [Streptomyces lydicus]